MWYWRGDHFEIRDCPNRLDRILVAARLSPSVAEATRLIKQGAIRLRRYDGDWARPREPRMSLPEGRLWQIRVGQSSWRLLPREGREGWEGLNAAVELMFPENYQGLRSWTDIMLRDTIRWHSYWLDKLEKSLEKFCNAHFLEGRAGRSTPAT